MTGNPKYQHSCRFCTYQWLGKIQNPVSCPKCKRRLDHDQKSVPGKAAAIRFIEANLISSGVSPSTAHFEAKRKLNSIIGFERSK